MNHTPVERAFLNALESPVPPELRAAVQFVARRELRARAFRRRVAWCVSPAAAAVLLIMLGLLANAPRNAPVPIFSLATTLVSLAAGGDNYHEEANIDSLAQDLLSLQGFCADY
jgi:hypothetical protein